MSFAKSREDNNWYYYNDSSCKVGSGYTYIVPLHSSSSSIEINIYKCAGLCKYDKTREN